MIDQLYTFFLIIHFTGAAAVLLLVAKAVIDMVTHRAGHLVQTAKGIVTVSLAQTISGLGMAMNNVENLAYSCRLLIFYLAVIGVVELFLLKQAHKANVDFPKEYVGGHFITYTVIIFAALFVAYS